MAALQEVEDCHTGPAPPPPRVSSCHELGFRMKPTMSHAVGKDWALLGQGRTLTRPGAAGREVKAQAPLSAHILRVAFQERQTCRMSP